MKRMNRLRLSLRCIPVIKSHKSTRVLYAERLASEGVITKEEADLLNSTYRDALDNGEHVVKSLVKEPSIELFVDWSPYIGHKWSSFYNTSIPLANLKGLAKKLSEYPESFNLQRQVGKGDDGRP